MFTSFGLFAIGTAISTIIGRMCRSSVIAVICIASMLTGYVSTHLVNKVTTEKSVSTEVYINDAKPTLSLDFSTSELVSPMELETNGHPGHLSKLDLNKNDVELVTLCVQIRNLVCSGVSPPFQYYDTS